ncbi:MAG: IS110 family transposase [Acidobacteria bacterium]|nr:IS110 family transposase [Acidobacteriota bacterium]
MAGIDLGSRSMHVAGHPLAGGTPEMTEFRTTTEQILQCVNRLREREVTSVAMESTAQYWKPVWIALEGKFELQLAQARSNKAPRGRKSDFADARRLVKRWRAEDLTLSYVPDAEQRRWRAMTRFRRQAARQRIQLQNQIESLLEEGQIKLSCVVSDLLGASGLRILGALADGETDTKKLAEMRDSRVRASEEQVRAALSGQLHPVHRRLLKLSLERVEQIDQQLAELELDLGQAMQAHQEAIARLAALPGLGVDSAQQVIAQIGPEAAAFPTSEQLASWVGVCPGRQESAGVSVRNRSPKGNRPMRKLINQLAWAAVKTEGSYFQLLFRRWVPRMGGEESDLGGGAPPAAADLEGAPPRSALRRTRSAGIEQGRHPTAQAAALARPARARLQSDPRTDPSAGLYRLIFEGVPETRFRGSCGHGHYEEDGRPGAPEPGGGAAGVR